MVVGLCWERGVPVNVFILHIEGRAASEDLRLKLQDNKLINGRPSLQGGGQGRV